MTMPPHDGRGFRVALDAMGGDNAPAEIVKGGIAAARDGATVFLVGVPERVQAELDKEDVSGLDLQIVPSDDAIEETEQPALALRRKPKASVLVATGLVKEGMADAVVSMGSTGALMASAHFLLGTLENLDRPVLGGPALGYAPNTIWLDMGGNVGLLARLNFSTSPLSALPRRALTLRSTIPALPCSTSARSRQKAANRSRRHTPSCNSSPT